MFGLECAVSCCLLGILVIDANIKHKHATEMSEIVKHKDHSNINNQIYRIDC